MGANTALRTHNTQHVMAGTDLDEELELLQDVVPSSGHLALQLLHAGLQLAHLGRQVVHTQPATAPTTRRSVSCTGLSARVRVRGAG